MNEEKRILGIDYGSKRVGLAISDPLFLIATPLETVDKRKVFDKIEEILKDFYVEKVVVGYPLRTDGKKGKSADEVERFTEKIKEKFGVEVELWDERFSTVEAERIMRISGEKPSRDKKKVDRVAASLILQSYLDNIVNK